jgi:hypothetical protein
VSNIIPANIKVPAHLAARMGTPSVLAQALAGGISGGSAFPRISIKASRFRIVEDGTETVLDQTKLDVVIVGANPRLSKTYYAKEWSKDAEPTAPDCFSLDGVRPSAESTGPQSDACVSCKWNVWGSKVTPNGQQVKACSDKKRLAVVAADDPTGPVYLLEVTPAALKGLNTYQKELSVRGISPEIVRTRIFFDTDASFPKLEFGFGGFLDEATMEAVDPLFDSSQVKEITGQEVASVPTMEVERPVSVRPAPKAAEPEAEEAAPKRGFGGAPKPAPAPKPAAKPVAKPVAAAPAAAATSLADEIASLLDEVGADDE